MHAQEVALNKVAVLNAQFVNEQGVATDPVTIVLTITKPDGTTIVKAIVDLIHVSDGRYQYHQTADQRGVWTFSFEGAGNGVDAIDTDYFVCGVTLHAGPCENWIAAEDIFNCPPCNGIDVADRDMGLALRMATAASEFYWTHSGRQFSGLCDVLIRPCCNDQCGSSRCGCPDPIMVALPRPVRGILDVYVDGALVPASSYRVDQSRWLVRTDGEPWPSCQNLRADPLTEQNTFQVHLIRGTAPPALGVLAVSELACELYRGCATGDCAIPQRVTNIARQGVTMQLIRPEELGIDVTGRVRTGLKAGQLFLATYPGNKGRARAAIASPDSRALGWRANV